MKPVMKKNSRKTDDAVSPVVGVMLMLVVTIIIAAVVAAFAGGFGADQKITPSAVIDTHIISLKSTDFTPTYPTYGKFEMNVLSITEPVSTKEVKLVTSYSTKDKEGNVVSSMTEVTPGTINTNYTSGTTDYEYASPIGFGPGVNGPAQTSGNYSSGQYFGNYTLMAGTYLSNSGSCYNTDNSSYSRTYEEALENDNEDNAMDALLGTNWIYLVPGDIVTVTLTDLRTNGVIAKQEVVVE